MCVCAYVSVFGMLITAIKSAIHFISSPLSFIFLSEIYFDTLIDRATILTRFKKSRDSSRRTLAILDRQIRFDPFAFRESFRASGVTSHTKFVLSSQNGETS